MFSSTLPIVLAALPLALAAQTVHTVEVGNGGLTFKPNAITAAVGDIVEFQFYPMAHSVAQSSFAAPCVPLNATSFFSGQVPSTSGVAAMTYQLEVNSTAPIWFFCATGKHCENGMAGVINQNVTSGKTIDAYITSAKNVSATKVPATVQGGVLAASLGGNSSTGSGSASPSGSSTSSSPSSTSSTKSAGVETRGSVAWMSLGVAGALAVAVGSLMV